MAGSPVRIIPAWTFCSVPWSVPVGMEIVILLGCGVTIAFGAYFLSQAYRVAQPAVVAPFEYGALPLSLFWGVMLWGHWPDATAMAGMTLIVGSGLYVFYRETMQGRRLTVRRFCREIGNFSKVLQPRLAFAA